MPAKRLYYENPYLKECRAKVVKISGESGCRKPASGVGELTTAFNGTEVFLDETCFFPEGGGQVGDTGEIDGVRVIDTKARGGHLSLKKEDYPSVIVGADIAHIVDEKPPFSEGDFVTAALDWERRYAIMQHHSAAHFVYYFFMQCFGEHPTKGCSIDDTKARFDFIVKERLEKDKLKEIQQLCNETISQELEILTVSDPAEPDLRMWKCSLRSPTASPYGSLRSPTTSSYGSLRSPTASAYGGSIEMPCGGTHVKNTKEIGKVRLQRINKGRGLERVNIFLVD